MIKIGKVYFSFFLAVLVFACMIFGAVEFMALSYLSLLIHEGFHLAFAFKMKIKINRIVVLPFGINIVINEKLSPVYEILLCIMGPFGSGIAAVIFLYIKSQGIAFANIDYLIISNFSTFIINILPIYPLDGGRIFKCLLENKIGYYRAVNISVWVSQLCIFVICVFIFTAVTVSKFNLSIMVLCCFLIYSLSFQKKEAIQSFSQLLVYSKQKLSEKGQLPVREIAIDKNSLIKDVFSHLSDNVYIIITVTDDRGKILERLSETQLIERFCTIKKAKYIAEII